MDNYKSIYNKIFDIADAGMKEHGGTFSYSRNTFLVLIKADPNVVDVNEFERLEGKEYLEAVYLRCLNRLPDKDMYQAVGNLKNESEISQKYMILSNVIHSAEFLALYKTVRGMKEVKRKWKQEKNDSRKQLPAVHMPALKSIIFGYLVVPIWVKLPNSIQEAVRKLTGRKSKLK